MLWFQKILWNNINQDLYDRDIAFRYISMNVEVTVLTQACIGLIHILFAATFLPNAPNWLYRMSDFFTMVEENFEIQSYQMLQIDSIKGKWFLHHGWRYFWNLVLPNAPILTQKS